MSNIKDFQKGLKAHTKKLEKLTKKEVKEGVFAVGLKGLIFKTPVDEGTARGNWNVEINKIDDSTNEGNQTYHALTEGKNTIDKFKMGDIIYFTNALPYINRLEYGWSERQAPNGMMRLTYQELKNHFKRISKRK